VPGTDTRESSSGTPTCGHRRPKAHLHNNMRYNNRAQTTRPHIPTRAWNNNDNDDNNNNNNIAFCDNHLDPRRYNTIYLLLNNIVLASLVTIADITILLKIPAVTVQPAKLL